MRRLLLGLLLLAAALPRAHADIACNAVVYNRPAAADTYYVLVLMDPFSTTDASARTQQYNRLVSRVKPNLMTILRKLSDPPPAKQRRLQLLLCEHQLRYDDLGREEIRKLFNAKVIAIFWKVKEVDQTELVQLAVPVFLKSPGAERENVEVAVLYGGKSDNTIESWIEALSEGNMALYRPFVAMGLASVYQREKDFKLAINALCDSHGGLLSLASNTLRPKGETLNKDIVAPLRGAINEVRQAGLQAGGSDLPTEAELQQLCYTRPGLLAIQP